MLGKLLRILVDEYGISAVESELRFIEQDGVPSADEVDEYARKMFGDIGRISRIKAMRAISGWDLRRSKLTCDRLFGYP